MKIIRQRFFWIFTPFMLFCSFWWHFAKLEKLPGVNGDELYTLVHLWERFHGREGAFVTPTGNVTFPFYDLIPLGLQYLFPPHFFLVRFSIALWGLATLLIFYFVLLKLTKRKLFSFLWTLLLSFSPALLAFSRFSWTPSLLPLLSLLFVYMAFRKQKVASFLLFLLTVWAHQIALFLAPFFLLLLPPFWIRLKFWKKIGLFSLLFILFLAMIPFSPVKMTPPVGVVVERLFDPLFWKESLFAVLDLVSGTEVSTYVTGESFPILEALLRAFFLLLTFFGGGLFIHKRSLFEKEWGDQLHTLILSWWLSWFFFALIAGPSMLSGGNVRYGYFLLSPLFLRVALLFAPFCDDMKKKGALFLYASIMMMASLTWVIYWHPLQEDSGLKERHHCFVSSSSREDEPKALLYREILKKKDSKRTTVVITPDWWVYWPLRYLDLQKRELKLVIKNQGFSPMFPRDYQEGMEAIKIQKWDIYQYMEIIFESDPLASTYPYKIVIYTNSNN